jgi:MFS family permease
LKKPGRGVYYGWIIVGILALSMMLAYATRSSFSVFYVAILDEFGWTRAETAGIFSVSLIVYGVGGILAGYLLDRLGPRKLFPMAATLIALGALWCSRATTIWEFYIAFGLIIGFGQCSLGYVPTMTVVNHWFIRYRGLAAGIALFGLSLSFLLSPLTQYLRETVGWRTAFMIFGAAVFFVVVPLTSIFMRHRPQTMGLLPDGVREMPENEDKSASKHDISVVDPKWASTDWTLARAFKTYRLWILLGVAFMMGIMVNFPQVHQVAYITDIGYSPMLAVTTFTVFGLLNGIGPLGGLISDRIGRERCATLPTLPSTYGDLFAGKNLGSIIGFINMGFGIGGAVGPYIAGYIYDVGGSYTAAFIMVLAVALIQATLMWLASPRKVRLVAGRTSSRS